MALNQSDSYNTIEKSSSMSLSFHVFFQLVDVFQSQIGSSRLSKFFSGVWLSTLGCSWNLDERRNLDNLSPTISSADEGLCREDAEMVMGRLGIFCNPEGEELKDRMSSNEVTGLFDEKEPSLEEVKEAFNVFDENMDGFIDARELQRVLCTLGLKEGSNLENCKKMIRAFDKNSDERIDFSEFVKFMENSFC